MKILFVSSGNNIFGISPIVLNQGKSLETAGIRIEYFTIKGKGFWGYLQSVFTLRKFLIKNKFDLIHAHYSLSALAASLSFPGIPIIVSLMGSDTKMGFFWRFIIRANTILFWKAVIVKSENMKKGLGFKKAFIIPNGVDLSKFIPIGKKEAQSLLNFRNGKKYILFLSDPSRNEKNFKLAEKAVKSNNNDNIILYPVFNKPHEEIATYLNASDLLINTSLWEGSPNVIKEAMACNVPIVSTDVGDVRWLLGETKGCWVCSFEPEDIAEKVNLALKYADLTGKTNGRERIIKLELDSNTSAQRIIDLYQSMIDQKVLTVSK